MPENTSLLLNDAMLLLRRDLDLEEATTSQFTPQSYDALHVWLASIIADWLQNRPDNLRLALYRLDVSEKKARMAIAQPEAAFYLADLIIEREWQKAETRAQYRAWCKRNAMPSDEYYRETIIENNVHTDLEEDKLC